MREWIIEVMSQWGYGGIVFLIALENVFPPIPSEVILTFGGFMTTCTEMTVWWVMIWATVGSLLGAVVLYFAGRLLGANKVMTLLDGKVGKLLHFRRADVESSMDWFEAKGWPAVFFCRCIPIVRSLISVPAGMAKMPFLPFFLLTAAGSVVWNTVLVYLGALAGNSWEKLAASFGAYSDVTTMVLLVLVPVITIVILRRKQKSSRHLP